MTNDNPATTVESLRAEHRQLDDRIRALSSEPTGDQLEVARLKRRKLMLKDQIQVMLDSTTPDIIACNGHVPMRDTDRRSRSERRFRRFLKQGTVTVSP